MSDVYHLSSSLYHVPRKVMLASWNHLWRDWVSNFDLLGCGMRLTTLYLFDICPGEEYLWQERTRPNKYETRKWSLHSLCGPCPSSPGTRPQSRSWVGMGWGVSQWKMVGKQICDGDSPVHHATSTGVWTSPVPTLGFMSIRGDLVDTKAQPHRLSGCISRSLWRGGWNFLCLAITVGWGGRHSSWGVHVSSVWISSLPRERPSLLIREVQNRTPRKE